MKAIQCLKFGMPDTLVLHEVPTPDIGANDVRISVRACGVGFPDTLIIQNKYQFKPPLPFSPGGEISGIVDAVGEKVKHLKPGDRVLALTGWGGFAEQVVTNAKLVFSIPADLDFITAASVLYSYGTSYFALKDRAQLQPGETLLVLGAAGGVGLTAVELGKRMGATVIAGAASEEKLAICREQGADFTINYTTEDLRTRIKEITNEKGVDVVYDPVGGDWAEPALRSLAWKGRYLVIGFAAGNIPKVPLNLPLLKGSSIVGVFWGSFMQQEPQAGLQNSLQILDWLKNGQLKQHIHKIYTLEQAPEALLDLMERRVKGKAVIKVSDWAENIVLPSTPTPETKETTEITTTKPLVLKNAADAKNYIGKSLGFSEWFPISQEAINDFAKATDDFQWIHVDIERAKAEMPGGKTLAHGYMSLSLASKFLYELITVKNAQMMLNYGVNKARFISPVPVGSRIRLHGKISNVEDMSNGGIKIFFDCQIELEGSEKPASVAEVISAIF